MTRSMALRFFAMHRKLIMLAFVIAVLVAAAMPAFAQTPVPLNIPTNEIFTQTNTWMSTFAPVVAIGIGIAVALAILGFLGQQIIKAFRGGGK